MRFIGSKVNLLESIESFIEPFIEGENPVFVDLFGGTNSVGAYFKSRFTILSNDLLYFSYLNARARIENNDKLEFAGLRAIGITSPLDYLQSKAEEYIKSGVVGYYEQSYSPSGGAMYFTIENAKRVDFIRDKIDEWNSQNYLTEAEFAYLVSVLISAIPSVSNTTGTYGAFLKHWDKRAFHPLSLQPIILIDNGRDNKSYNLDANELIKGIEADIAYIDTPYNNRQYASNYHVLENIARNTKPVLHGVTRIYDWQEQKSAYAAKTTAFEVMKDLIENAMVRHIVVSYNSEGIIPEADLLGLLRKNAKDSKVDVQRIPYRKYKSKIPATDDSLFELLFHIEKGIPAKKRKSDNLPSRKRRQNLQSSASRRTVNESSLTISEWQAHKETYLKSPLNYIGGKYRLLKQIIPLFPEKIETFVDLFSGGANVGINVRAKKHIFNDMNIRINEMFRLFAVSDPDVIIEEIKRRISEWGLSKTNEAAYLEFRRLYNLKPNPLDLYILSSFSYNYQFRFNNSMEFNNPFGRNRSCFSANMEKNLRQFILRLRQLDATFTDLYFENFDFEKLGSLDFVYLDPPYLITTGSYNDGNRGFKDWGDVEEENLYRLLAEFSERNIRFALSNVVEHKGVVNERLQEFIASENVNVHDLLYDYNNSSHNSKRRGSREVLVTNY